MSAIMKETEVIGGLITPLTTESDYAFKYDGTEDYKGITIERFGNVRTLSFNQQYNVNISAGSIRRSDGSGGAVVLDAKDLPKAWKTGLIVYMASSSSDLTANYVYTALCIITSSGSVQIKPIVDGTYGWHTDPKAFLLGSITYIV